MVHHTEEDIKINFFGISKWQIKGTTIPTWQIYFRSTSTTIEQFVISHKIERIKELIIYGELNIYRKLPGRWIIAVLPIYPINLKKWPGYLLLILNNWKTNVKPYWGDRGIIWTTNDLTPINVNDLIMERTKSHESQYASSLIEASLDPLFCDQCGWEDHRHEPGSPQYYRINPWRSY